MDDLSQTETHHSDRGLSADSPQTSQAPYRDKTVLPLALRLLAHPTYGAQGISDAERRQLLDAARAIEQIGIDLARLTDAERRQLLDAARAIEQIGADLARLTDRVRDLSIEADQLRGMTA